MIEFIVKQPLINTFKLKVKQCTTQIRKNEEFNFYNASNAYVDGFVFYICAI